MATITVSDNTGATVGGVEDNELSQFAPTTNLGTEAQAYIDAWVSPDYIVTLIMRVPIPSGSGTVSNDKLRLYMTEKGGGKTALSVYEILVTDWVESEATFNDSETGVAWNTGGAQGAGTDRSSSAIATADVSGISTGNYVEFTGSGLTALAQDAIDNAKTSFNIVVQFTDLSFTSQSYVRFVTSEGTDGQRPEYVYDLDDSAVTAEITEAITSSESSGATVIAAVSISNANSVTEQNTSTALYAASIANALSGAETASSTIATSSSIAETGTADDTTNAIASQISIIAEANNATSTQSTQLITVASITNALTALDIPTATMNAIATGLEALNAVSSQSSVNGLQADSDESATATDTQDADTGLLGTTNEANSAISVQTCIATLSAIANEPLNAIDTRIVALSLVATITETANAQDFAEIPSLNPAALSSYIRMYSNLKASKIKIYPVGI